MGYREFRGGEWEGENKGFRGVFGYGTGCVIGLRLLDV